MLYLGIDLHRKQMTVSLRNELGDMVLRRQVSTGWKKVDEFLEQVDQAGDEESYVANVGVFEVTSSTTRPSPCPWRRQP